MIEPVAAIINDMKSEASLVPPIETATDPIHSTADLRMRWRALMGRLGFTERMLWVGFVGPDRCMPKILADLQRPARPNPGMADSLMDELSSVLDDEFEPGTSVALLLTGPGRGPVSESRSQWAAVLSASATKYGVPLQPIFSADDHDLVEVVQPLRRAG